MNLSACLRSTKILTPFPLYLLGSSGTPHVYLKQRWVGVSLDYLAKNIMLAVLIWGKQAKRG